MEHLDWPEAQRTHPPPRNNVSLSSLWIPGVLRTVGLTNAEAEAAPRVCDALVPPTSAQAFEMSRDPLRWCRRRGQCRVDSRACVDRALSYPWRLAPRCVLRRETMSTLIWSHLH